MKAGFLLWLLLGFFSVSHACEVIDDAGRVVKLSQSARRIVSLAPDLTEQLFAIGAGDKIVGVDRNSDYPSKTKHLSLVASFDHVDVERLLALHPDLIVAWTDGPIDALKKLGVPLYLSHQSKIRNIPETLQRLGCLAGTEVAAHRAAEKFLAHYYRLKNNASHQKVLPVFYQIGFQPLMTVSHASWIDEIITLCGGENIFANLYGVAPEVDVEVVIGKNPDIIIGTDKVAVLNQQWTRWHSIAAVKKQNLFSVNADLIERAGPRLLDGADEICNAIAVAGQKEMA